MYSNTNKKCQEQNFTIPEFISVKSTLQVDKCKSITAQHYLKHTIKVKFGTSITHRTECWTWRSWWRKVRQSRRL